MSSQNNTMTLHRVVITGMGAVSPAGTGRGNSVVKSYQW